ncbi:MAG TPA: hypothetical protein DCE56_41300 [Cyanobacteria bacterium UBA8553]|nr:hypothetical protein [Cyanobacteria bacterium UBA8553]HAJ59784.1 hypothetical protein [Cyanobacteria bacterium UBA8543]
MSTRSSSLLYSPRPIGDSQAVINRPTAPTGNPSLLEQMKSPYRADQQVKYLHLQAEVESLLQQLEILKKQRLASDFTQSYNQGQ